MRGALLTRVDDGLERIVCELEVYHYHYYHCYHYDLVRYHKRNPSCLVLKFPDSFACFSISHVLISFGRGCFVELSNAGGCSTCRTRLVG